MSKPTKSTDEQRLCVMKVGEFYRDEQLAVLNGDCREAMHALEANSIAALVCDPPYGLEFMGKKWDKLGAGVESTPKSAGGFGKDSATNENAFTAARIRYGKSVANVQEWHRSWAVEALRVLKPGAHALVFGGTRTHHRLMCGLEDAGFEIRDCVMWVYGSGFPKSLDVSKAIDKRDGKQIGWFGPWLREWREASGVTQKQIAELFPSKTGGLTGCVANWELGLNMPTPEQFNLICQVFSLPFASLAEAEREIIGHNDRPPGWFTDGDGHNITVAASDPAKQWDGWGTALKPAWEPIIIARKPLEGTVAENVLKYGTGAMNIDECRVPGQPEATRFDPSKHSHDGWRMNATGAECAAASNGKGRWPANVIHDGSDEVIELFPVTSSGAMKRNVDAYEGESVTGFLRGQSGPDNQHGDSGSAARFFQAIPRGSQEVSKDRRYTEKGGIRQNSASWIKWTVGNGRIRLEAMKTDVGDASAEIACDYSGDDYQWGASSAQMLPVLKAAGVETLTLHFDASKPGHPITFTAPGLIYVHYAIQLHLL